MTKLIISDSAQRDLADILAYIAADNPSAARKLAAGLREAVNGLARLPEAYPQLPDRADIRRRVVGRYNIFFRSTPERVEIVRILHAARDRDALLGP